jgi:hypothetical protein
MKIVHAYPHLHVCMFICSGKELMLGLGDDLAYIAKVRMTRVTPHPTPPTSLEHLGECGARFKAHFAPRHVYVTYLDCIGYFKEIASGLHFFALPATNRLGWAWLSWACPRSPPSASAIITHTLCTAVCSSQGEPLIRETYTIFL